MLANLDRQKFIDLLEQLGAEEDEAVLAAARDLHAQITVADMTWDTLLVPEPSDEEDVEEVEPDEEYDEEDLEDEDEESDDEDDERVNEAAAAEESDLFADVDEDPLDDEQKAEALSLISQISAIGVSADTKEELDDYKVDIEEGEFGQMDLNYLKALHKRLAK